MRRPDVVPNLGRGPVAHLLSDPEEYRAKVAPFRVRWVHKLRSWEDHAGTLK